MFEKECETDQEELGSIKQAFHDACSKFKQLTELAEHDMDKVDFSKRQLRSSPGLVQHERKNSILNEVHNQIRRISDTTAASYFKWAKDDNDKWVPHPTNETDAEQQLAFNRNLRLVCLNFNHCQF